MACPNIGKESLQSFHHFHGGLFTLDRDAFGVEEHFIHLVSVAQVGNSAKSARWSRHKERAQTIPRTLANAKVEVVDGSGNGAS